jgi:hypothetical protein
MQKSESSARRFQICNICNLKSATPPFYFCILTSYFCILTSYFCIL